MGNGGKGSPAIAVSASGESAETLTVPGPCVRV